MNAFGLATYLLAAAFWMVTGIYTLLASRQFIVEQFLKPELFAPLTIFARYWSVSAIATFAAWLSARRSLLRHRELMVIAPTMAWVLAAAAAATPGVSAAVVGPAAMWVSIGAVMMLWLLAVAEHPVPNGVAPESAGHTSADFFACLLAAVVMTAIEQAIDLLHGGVAADAVGQALLTLRMQVLAAMMAFLVLTIARGFATWFSRPAAVEARTAIIAIGVLIGWFLYRVALPSISLDGPLAGAAALAGGYVMAVSITAPAMVRFRNKGDGIRSVAAAFAPSFARQWLGLAGWMIVAGAIAIGIDSVTRLADWNFVLARLGVVIVWLGVLGGALRCVKTPASGHAAVFLGLAVAVLAAHTALDRWGVPSAALTPRTPATRWAVDLMRPAANGPSELFALLPAQTNITGAANRKPVNVTWAPLAGAPSASRPNIFLFIVDSLRRDYVSPYNNRVTFTPGIAAFARDSLVFDRAFTQYGATGLSVPSIWIGGSLLHKQYVTPFAPMNALAKLLTHEQYAQWLSLDNIVDVIVPKTGALEPLDRGRPVKDLRFCSTLEELRARLTARAADAPPLFAYSLPQDVHISVISREGSRSIDAATYDGFYAPVASRVRRFDACFGAFVDDLKGKGLYDSSIIIVTADHGDSLGEEGRMGHAYTLYPEIARIPLIVHVPAALRDRYAWDTTRAAYTTDLTPTLYQLLGHAPSAPGDFYGESLAREPSSPAVPPRDRMIASSYGSVYGGVLRGGTAMYVADAIERRELQFSIGAGAEPGRRVDVDPATRRDGATVIKTTVQSLARAYQMPVPR